MRQFKLAVLIVCVIALAAYEFLMQGFIFLKFWSWFIAPDFGLAIHTTTLRAAAFVMVLRMALNIRGKKFKGSKLYSAGAGFNGKKIAELTSKS